MAEEKQLGYKRLHFFKFRLTEEDWNHRHNYHAEKLTLHQQVFHAYGVVPYQLKELSVVQTDPPSLEIKIMPGQGLVPNGNNIILRDAIKVTIPADSFHLPGTVYLVARHIPKKVDNVGVKYRIKGTDEVKIKKMNRYVQDTIEFEVVGRRPEENEIELARFYLRDGVTSVNNARNPQRPLPNEIDLRGRIYARVFRKLEMDKKAKLLDAIRQRREAYMMLAGNKILRPSAASAFSLSMFEQLVQNDMLPPMGMVELLDNMIYQDENVAGLIRSLATDPTVLEQPAVKQFLLSSDTLRSLMHGDRQKQFNSLDQIVNFMQKSNGDVGALAQLYGNRSLFYKEGQELALPTVYEMGPDWEYIKVWSKDFPDRWTLDGLEWKLIGTLDITDEKSERSYRFRIDDVVDAWRTRQKLRYPDGTERDETGVAHEGGWTEFELRNVMPDTDLAIIRMMDYARGDYEVEMYVNDDLVGVSICEGSDRRNRWRNWPFVIPARYVDDHIIRVRQVLKTAARDVNMFKYWFYQPVDL